MTWYAAFRYSTTTCPWSCVSLSRMSASASASIRTRCRWTMNSRPASGPFVTRIFVAKRLSEIGPPRGFPRTVRDSLAPGTTLG